ncbi:MAG: Asp23/Gls24 family envelope stress response protein [Specibacter sp.]
MDGQNQPSETSGTISSDYAQGRTVISDTAVAKVVGVAARSVAGVHALGSGASRSIGAIRDVVGATDLTQGVRVEVGESQVAVDIILMAEYGYPLQNVANTVRAAVYAAVEDLVGRSVIEVNIEITDVFIPAADIDKQPARPKLAERLGSAVKVPATTAGTEEQP